MADRLQKRRIDLLHQVLHSDFEEQERELQLSEQTSSPRYPIAV